MKFKYYTRTMGTGMYGTGMVRNRHGRSMGSIEPHISKVLPNEILTTTDISHIHTYIQSVKGVSQPFQASKGLLQGLPIGGVGFQSTHFTQL